MKDWILSLAVSAFFITILGLLLPNGKLSNFIKKTLSVLLIFVIIQPIIKLRDKELNFNLMDDVFNVETQTNYLEYVGNKKVISIQNQCVEIVKKCGINGAIVELTYDFDEEYKLQILSSKIILSNSVIKEDKSHIDIIEQAKELISKHLNIEKENVYVYVE